MSLYAGLDDGDLGQPGPPPTTSASAAPAPAQETPPAPTAAPAKPATSSWSVSLEMMAPQLRRKRAALKAQQAALKNRLATPSAKRSIAAVMAKTGPTAAAAAPVVTVVTESVAPVAAAQAVDEAFDEVPEKHLRIADPYDPFRPNEYELAVEQRRIAEQNPFDDDAMDVGGEREAKRHHGDNGGAQGTARAGSPTPLPQPLNQANLPQPGENQHNLNETADEVYERRLRMSQQGQQGSQGMPAKAPERATGKPSPVVLLLNMVRPSEVDDDLRQETAEECAKFGPVANCVIHVCPPAVGGDGTVRIFVEFREEASAAKAIANMNGRFFGGNRVSARCYDAARFRDKKYVD